MLFLFFICLLIFFSFFSCWIHHLAVRLCSLFCSTHPPSSPSPCPGSRPCQVGWSSRSAVSSPSWSPEHSEASDGCKNRQQQGELVWTARLVNEGLWQWAELVWCTYGSVGRAGPGWVLLNRSSLPSYVRCVMSDSTGYCWEFISLTCASVGNKFQS